MQYLSKYLCLASAQQPPARPFFLPRPPHQCARCVVCAVMGWQEAGDGRRGDCTPSAVSHRFPIDIRKVSFPRFTKTRTDLGKMYDTAAIIEWLSQSIEIAQSTNINFFHPSIQFNLLHFVACLLVCKLYRSKNRHERYWLESLICVFLLRFGGTFLMAIMLGQPPSWMLVHSTPLSLFLAWWLTFCSPGDFYWKYLADNKLLFEVVSVVDAISQGLAITSWGMDKALFGGFHNNSAIISNALVLNVICGVVSSNGGGILADVLGFYEKNSFTLTRSPAFLSTGAEGDISRKKLTKCFLLACLYFSIIKSPSVHDLPWFPNEASERKLFGHMVVCILQILDLVQLKLAGPSANAPGYIAKIALNLLQIPRTVQIPPSEDTSEVATSSESKIRKSGRAKKATKFD